jgi:S-adenosylmethionine:tRNA ribosyltransferase-isomerase
MTEKSAKTAFSLDDFTYDLPEELIAQEPPAVRHASRLLWVDRESQQFTDRQFADLPDLLTPGDLLVVNDTKVIPARLLARRETGGHVEILLLRPEASRQGTWLAMATPLRKLRTGERLTLAEAADYSFSVADIVTAEDGQKRVLLDFGGQGNVYDMLTDKGMAPLPPYIKREETDDTRRAADLQRYQTIYAQAPGAVAAPTAGLHFSQQLFDSLSERGIGLQKITLHVGPGTFKPITDSLENHTIEAERFSISPAAAEAINKALAEKRRVIAVGTTTCRALETAGATGRLQPHDDASTSLYIRPGFEFRVISGLITNFHLSKSSLLVLVSAFGGYDLIMRAYKHAVAQQYRFFSYGDAMLIT